MSLEVLVTDYAWPSLSIERDVLAAVGAKLIVAGPDDEELVEGAARADAILTNWRRIPPAALEAAERCVIVSRYGVGVDNIPVDVATRLGILVTNVPDFCLDEVSDHTMALILACSRRVCRFQRHVQEEGWDLRRVAPGIRRLRGQTLGLIGYGRLGRALAAKAVAFGLAVLAYSPRLSPGEIGPGVMGTNDLQVLLGSADYVSLHAPATEETKRIVDEHALRSMKATAFLVNTSRGALVDETALYRALTEGWIAGAALDVMTVEPAQADNPLLRLDNVIITPHAAFYSEEAIAELQLRASSHVAAALRWETPPHIVNPQVMDAATYRLGPGGPHARAHP